MISSLLEEQGSSPEATPKIIVHDSSIIVFDIETGPAPLEEIEAHLPEIKAPSNYKDPEKINAYIAEQRQSMIERAALSPLTGRVLAIGVWADSEYRSFIGNADGSDEADCIRWFFHQINVFTSLVGFNSNSFDLPFLFRRAWALGIDVPLGRLDRNLRIQSAHNIDLLDVYRMGDRGLYISLDSLARYLGVGEKNGDGELFYKTLRIAPDEAAAYLKNDVALTFAVAKRFECVREGDSWPNEVVSPAEPITEDY